MGRVLKPQGRRVQKVEVLPSRGALWEFVRPEASRTFFRDSGGFRGFRVSGLGFFDTHSVFVFPSLSGLGFRV